MGIKIPFGKRHNKLVHISEISDDENGLKCNCKCISCGSKLVARIGNKKARHFSHYNECSCNGGIETALHLFAKEVLSESKRIVIPKLEVQYWNYSWNENQFSIITEEKYRIKEIPKEFKKHEDYEIIKPSLNRRLICERQLLEFEEVKSEENSNNIKPDLIVYKNNKPLLIEIAVTHFIDDIKKSKIYSYDKSTIEINLSKYKDEFHLIDKNELKNIIINDVENKTWIHNTRCKKIISSLIVENKNNHYKIKKDILTRIKREEEIRNEKLYILEQKKKLKEEIEMKKQRELEEKFRDLEKYEDNIFKEYRKELFKTKSWTKLSSEYHITSNEIPRLLDVKTSNDIVFKADRVLWQYYIYSKFILNKKDKLIWIKSIIEGIKKNVPVHRELISYKSKDRIEEAVIEYIEYLVNEGVLVWRSKGGAFGANLIIVNDKIL